MIQSINPLHRARNFVPVKKLKRTVFHYRVCSFCICKKLLKMKQSINPFHQTCHFVPLKSRKELRCIIEIAAFVFSAVAKAKVTNYNFQQIHVQITTFSSCKSHIGCWGRGLKKTISQSTLSGLQFCAAQKLRRTSLRYRVRTFCFRKTLLKMKQSINPSAGLQFCTAQKVEKNRVALSRIAAFAFVKSYCKEFSSFQFLPP